MEQCESNVHKGIPKWHLEERSLKLRSVLVKKLLNLVVMADALFTPKHGIMVYNF